MYLSREPSNDSEEKRSWRRAEQKVQAEGAQRLNGMSGHELSKHCEMKALEDVLAHFVRCR